MSNTCRIGVGGPVGSGKTALIEAITPYFLKLGLQVLIITNDIVTTEDAKHVRKMLKGYLQKNGLSVSRPVLVPIRPYGKTLR